MALTREKKKEQEKPREEKKSREQKKQEEAAAPSGAIRVKICGKENGLEVYEGVSFVRVRSKTYNLMIMKDYLPIIGRIEGEISFRTDEEAIERKGVYGFFMHKNNEFSLMLEDVVEVMEAPASGKSKKKRKAEKAAEQDKAAEPEAAAAADGTAADGAAAEPETAAADGAEAEPEPEPEADPDEGLEVLEDGEDG